MENFTMVPNEIWEVDIPVAAKFIWCYLWSQQNRPFLSQNNVAKNLKMDRKVVNRSIEILTNYNMVLFRGRKWTLLGAVEWTLLGTTDPFRGRQTARIPPTLKKEGEDKNISSFCEKENPELVDPESDSLALVKLTRSDDYAKKIQDVIDFGPSSWYKYMVNISMKKMTKPIRKKIDEAHRETKEKLAMAKITLEQPANKEIANIQPVPNPFPDDIAENEYKAEYLDNPLDFLENK